MKVESRGAAAGLSSGARDPQEAPRPFEASRHRSSLSIIHERACSTSQQWHTAEVTRRAFAIIQMFEVRIPTSTLK